MTAHELKNEMVPQTQTQTQEKGVFAFLAALVSRRKREPAPPTLDELGRKGEAWVREIAKKLPADNAGLLIAVHIPTGDYVVDDDYWYARETLRETHPTGAIFKARLSSGHFCGTNDAALPK